MLEELITKDIKLKYRFSVKEDDVMSYSRREKIGVIQTGQDSKRAGFRDLRCAHVSLEERMLIRDTRF